MPKQCETCPWRVEADPHEIPNGYSEALHEGLDKTIAKDTSLGSALNIMACHYSETGKETPCVGWLENQLGVGNNIGLRLWAMKNLRGQHLITIGEQHQCFEDTLPKNKAVCRG